MEERDIVNAYQAAALDDEAGAVSPSAEYVPYQPQEKRPSLEALEEESMFIESSAEIRKRAESRADQMRAAPPPAVAKQVVKAVADPMDEEAMDLALQMEIAAEGLEGGSPSGSIGSTPKLTPASTRNGPPPSVTDDKPKEEEGDGGFADELKAALESDDDEDIEIDVALTPSPVVTKPPSKTPAVKSPQAPAAAERSSVPSAEAAGKDEEDDEDDLLKMMEGELAEEGFDLDNLDLDGDDLDDLDNEDFLQELEAELNA